MSIQASLSSTEVTKQMTDRFVNSFFEARLINAPSLTYVPGVTNDATFLSNEVSSGGEVTALGSVTTEPIAGNDGNYPGLATTNSGTGTGLTIEVDVASDVFTYNITDSGSGYKVNDVITISEAVLVAAGAVEAGAGNIDLTVAAVAVPGGYQRQVIGYYSGDVSTYSDGGVAMIQKATVFAQDGSPTPITFSHVALVTSSGNVLTTGAPSAEPSPVTDGTYQALPATTITGGGEGLKIDLEIVSNVSTVTISNAGRNYAAGDEVTVSESVLVAAGAGAVGCGPLSFEVATVQTGPENIFSVAKATNQVVLGGGNEAVFYWNLKLFNQSA